MICDLKNLGGSDTMDWCTKHTTQVSKMVEDNLNLDYTNQKKCCIQLWLDRDRGVWVDSGYMCVLYELLYHRQYICESCPSAAAEILYVKLECMVFLNANECYIKGHKTQVSISSGAWLLKNAEKAKKVKK